MSFVITITPGYDFPPGIPIGLDELRAAASPTVTLTGGLNDLDDVSPTAATVTGQALVWNNSTSKWEPSGTIQVRNRDLGLMQGASTSNDGVSGAVPTPLKANVTQFLRGDGLWATPTIVGTSGNDLFLYFNYY